MLLRLAFAGLMLAAAWPLACGSSSDRRKPPADAGADSSRVSDAASDAADGAARCLHDVCDEGALLDPACSPCVAAVCEEEEYCCLVRWEAGCVALALEQPSVCACAPESRCDDLVDDDQDGSYDCDDQDCRNAGACGTGMGTVGDACTENADCAASGEDPLCVNEELYEWPGGFCTEFCSLEDDDCPVGGLCQDIGLPGGRGVCQLGCALDAGSVCRDGYECREDRGQGPFCQPRFEDCANGLDDDLDGRIDCGEFDCLYADNCWEVCDDGIDDNRDGKTDCEDVRCVDSPACATYTFATCLPRPEPSSCVEIGAPGFPCDPVTSAGCLQGQTCELAGGTFLCFGPPNDLEPCERCGGLRGRCAPGTHCMYIGSARCAPFCCADADCGDGALCNKAYVANTLSRIESPVGVCVTR